MPRAKSQELRAATRGFTLIEVLVVISIIAILAGLLLPTLSKARQAAREAAAKQAMQAIAIALEGYRADWSDYPPEDRFGSGDEAGSKTLGFYLCMKHRPRKLVGGQLVEGELYFGPYLRNLSAERFNDATPTEPELLSPINNTAAKGCYKYTRMVDPADTNQRKQRCLVIDAGLDGLWGGDIDPTVGFVTNGNRNDNGAPAYMDNILSSALAKP